MPVQALRRRLKLACSTASRDSQQQLACHIFYFSLSSTNITRDARMSVILVDTRANI